ncbi:hypothetical protein YN28_002095 [Salmonella enterica subsp. enterica]|nr:hypothetical protein [Salmonella enterica subsp. enterica]
MVVFKWIFIERWKFKKMFSGVDVDIATFLTIAWERNISGCREYPGIFKDMQRILTEGAHKGANNMLKVNLFLWGIIVGGLLMKIALANGWTHI